MNDATIIYYTASQEDPKFEEMIRYVISMDSYNLPIISVSQKPIEFGKNICVGEVGVSGFNMCRQILIGCMAATTRFVISAEADCLYPPDYFLFRPKRDDIPYRNTNTYLWKHDKDYFYKKNEGGTWSQVVNREFYIKRLIKLFEGAPEWSIEEKNFPKERGQKLFEEFEYFQTENPCISMKTGKGMRSYSHSERVPIYKLPYWESTNYLRELYGFK